MSLSVCPSGTPSSEAQNSTRFLFSKPFDCEQRKSIGDKYVRATCLNARLLRCPVPLAVSTCMGYISHDRWVDDNNVGPEDKYSTQQAHPLTGHIDTAHTVSAVHIYRGVVLCSTARAFAVAYPSRGRNGVAQHERRPQWGSPLHALEGYNCVGSLI